MSSHSESSWFYLHFKTLPWHLNRGRRWLNTTCFPPFESSFLHPLPLCSSWRRPCVIHDAREVLPPSFCVEDVRFSRRSKSNVELLSHNVTSSALVNASFCSPALSFLPPLLLFILPPADEKQLDQTKVKLSFSASLSFITTQAVFWNERSNWQVLKWNLCVRRWHFTSEELSRPAPPAGGWLRVLTLSSLVRFLGCEAPRNGQDVFFSPPQGHDRGDRSSVKT